MKFTLFATAIVAASAIQVSRDLNADAKDEKTSWADFISTQAAIGTATAAYTKAKGVARSEEAKLATLISNVNTQEDVVKKANADALSARQTLFTATMQAHKALESYMKTMAADKLAYSR